MITSLTNKKVKYVRRLQEEKRFRTREKMFVIEGTRWILELIQLLREPEIVFFTEDWLYTADNTLILQQISSSKQVVSNQVMAVMSDNQSPPGILAVLSQVEVPLASQPSLLLILDEITNPGNLGTILRSAGGAGADGVILGPGCVDAYNPKAVRGGMGAHFRLPILTANWEEIAQFTTGMGIWVATADGEIDYTAVSWIQPSVLIIGGEAGGVGNKARKLATRTIGIPMHAATESLNAAIASAIILFEAARQRRS